MRGKVPSENTDTTYTRITPAYAGKRKVETRKPAGRRDHPRLCGEKIKLLEINSHYAGSPPPMRGKAQNGSKRRRVHRITPAYAGKRNVKPKPRCCSRDHPRLCGEKFASRWYLRPVPGSPPPMRGKVKNVPKIVFTTGITPAYAGKRK